MAFFIDIREEGKPTKIFLSNQYSWEEMKELLLVLNEIGEVDESYLRELLKGTQLKRDYIIKVRRDTMLTTESFAGYAKKGERILVHPDCTFEKCKSFAREVYEELALLIDEVLELEV